MILTDKFVLLNMPKTGSTFARKCLAKIHGYDTWYNQVLQRVPLLQPISFEMKELILPKIYSEYAPYKKIKDQHAVYSQIPTKHRHKKVVSIIRNPFEKIISVYEFAFWKKHPVYNELEIKSFFPKYPDLSFEEFVDFYHHFWVKFLIGEKEIPIDIGPQTLLHIKFYGKDPGRIINELSTSFRIKKNKDFANVIFLHTENINAELYHFLKDIGYETKKIEFIKRIPPINATARTRKKYVTPAIRQKILEKERLLFDCFPEYINTYD